MIWGNPITTVASHLDIGANDGAPRHKDFTLYARIRFQDGTQLGLCRSLQGFGPPIGDSLATGVQRDVMWLIFLAGAVFVTGSVGFEMLEGPIDEAGGYMNLLYTVYVTCEESLEMFGVCILIFALLQYVAVTSPDIRILVSNSSPSRPENPNL